MSLLASSKFTCYFCLKFTYKEKMNLMINKIALFTILLILVSCQNTDEKPTKNTPVSAQNPKLVEIQNLVDRINSDAEELTVANSLFYQHNDKSTEEVFAYLNNKQQIVKIEEKYKNGKTGNSGVRFFYFDAGKKILSEERFIDALKSKGKFRERISFYDENGKPFYTKQRVTQFEEGLEKIEFNSVKLYDCSTETAQNVLNQKGIFSTTFQGFATDGPIDYLIVGGPGESGYASALAVQFSDGQINYLKANQERMIDSPLTVEFEKMMDQHKLEFQVLKSVQIDK
jgi:hypothetical protein